MSSLSTPRLILVVDDEKILAELTSRFLEAAGHCTETVFSGEEALRKLEQGGFDLVVTDIRMPGMSGMELSRRICASHPHLTGRILFMTADHHSPEVQRFLVTSDIPFIAKPFDRAVLVAAITRLLSD